MTSFPQRLRYKPFLASGAKLSLIEPRDDAGPALLVISADAKLMKVVTAALRSSWHVEHASDAIGPSDLAKLADVKLVVLDDEQVVETDRGWLITQIRRNVPDAAL